MSQLECSEDFYDVIEETVDNTTQHEPDPSSKDPESLNQSLVKKIRSNVSSLVSKLFQRTPYKEDNSSNGNGVLDADSTRNRQQRKRKHTVEGSPTPNGSPSEGSVAVESANEPVPSKFIRLAHSSPPGSSTFVQRAQMCRTTAAATPERIPSWSQATKLPRCGSGSIWQQENSEGWRPEPHGKQPHTSSKAHEPKNLSVFAAAAGVESDSTPRTRHLTGFLGSAVARREYTTGFLVSNKTILLGESSFYLGGTCYGGSSLGMSPFNRRWKQYAEFSSLPEAIETPDGTLLSSKRRMMPADSSLTVLRRQKQYSELRVPKILGVSSMQKAAESVRQLETNRAGPANSSKPFEFALPTQTNGTLPQKITISPKINRIRPELVAKERDQAVGLNLPHRTIGKDPCMQSGPANGLSGQAITINRASENDTPQLVATIKPTINSSHAVNADGELLFTFTLPEILGQQTIVTRSLRQYSFGLPELLSVENFSAVRASTAAQTSGSGEKPPLSFQEIMASAAVGHKWECDVCMVRNEETWTKCVACESPKPKAASETTNAAVSKTCVTAAKTNGSGEKPPLSFQELMASAAAGHRWECDVCMVRNEASRTKCVACESPKPKAASTTTNAAAVQTGGLVAKPALSFQEIMASAAADHKWECDVCMVRNEETWTKCVACESPKPKASTKAAAAKTSVAAAQTSGSVAMPSSFQELMASAAGGHRWECDVCMVRNEANRTQCAACESPKPKAASTTTNAADSNTSVTAAQTTTNAAAVQTGGLVAKPALSFQEIMASAAADHKWECDVCMVRNEATRTKCVACESPKPKEASTTTNAADSNTSVTAAQTSGSGSKPPLSFQELMASAAAGHRWECDVCMVRNEANRTKCVACESPKPKATMKSAASERPGGGVFSGAAMQYFNLTDTAVFSPTVSKALSEPVFQLGGPTHPDQWGNPMKPHEEIPPRRLKVRATKRLHR